MAARYDKRIEQLTSKTSLAEGDLFVIGDSADKTSSNRPKQKKILFSNIINSIRIGLAQFLLPEGGTSNQVLKKSSEEDFDVEWGEGGQSTVQSDWNVDDPDDDAFILNKPSIPSSQLLIKKLTIPIEYPEDYDPEETGIIASETEVLKIGNKYIRAREFSVDNNVTWDLNLPYEYDLSEPFKYRVRGFIIYDGEPTLYQNKFINFNLSGFSNENENSPESEDFGDETLLTYTTPSDVETNTFFVTDWSEDIILENLYSVDNSNQLKFSRIHGSQAPTLLFPTDAPVYITDIEILYKENLSGIYPTPVMTITLPEDGDEIMLDTYFTFSVDFYKVWDFKLLMNIDGGGWIETEMKTKLNPATTTISSDEFGLPSSQFSVGQVIGLKLVTLDNLVESNVVYITLIEPMEEGWLPLGEHGLI